MATITPTIKANYNAILGALQKAAITITSATTTAAGGLDNAAKGVVQSEVDQLTADLKTIQDTLSGIGATVHLTATDLSPAAQSVVTAEVTAVKSAIEPFVKPVNNFAAAVQNVAATSAVTVRGLQPAYYNLNVIIQRLVGSLGLPPYTPPSVPAPP